MKAEHVFKPSTTLNSSKSVFSLIGSFDKKEGREERGPETGSKDFKSWSEDLTDDQLSPHDQSSSPPTFF